MYFWGYSKKFGTSIDSTLHPAVDCVEGLKKFVIFMVYVSYACIANAFFLMWLNTQVQYYEKCFLTVIR